LPLHCIDKMWDCNEVIDRLFVGSCRDSAHKEALLEHNITHIVTVADNLIPLYKYDFKYLVIDATDTEDQDLFSHFDA